MLEKGSSSKISVTYFRDGSMLTIRTSLVNIYDGRPRYSLLYHLLKNRKSNFFFVLCFERGQINSPSSESSLFSSSPARYKNRDMRHHFIQIVCIFVFVRTIRCDIAVIRFKELAEFYIETTERGNFFLVIIRNDSLHLPFQIILHSARDDHAGLTARTYTPMIFLRYQALASKQICPLLHWRSIEDTNSVNVYFKRNISSRNGNHSSTPKSRWRCRICRSTIQNCWITSSRRIPYYCQVFRAQLK